jgi:hypothetical protein
MGNRTDLVRLAAVGPFDVIIDDASHASRHQQIALDVLFSFVKPGGLYIIEDLHWQPPGDIGPQTRRLLRSGAILPVDACDVAFYDSDDARNKDRVDALAVIRRR